MGIASTTGAVAGDGAGRPGRREILEAFSRGELTTRQATARLGVGYGTVLDLLREEGLPRYRVPDEVARPMIDDFVSLIPRRG